MVAKAASNAAAVATLAAAAAVGGLAAGGLAVAIERLPAVLQSAAWSALPDSFPALLAVAVPACLLLAFLFPARVAYGLLVVLLLQDGLVGVGLKPAQYADEALVLALTAALGLHALRQAAAPAPADAGGAPTRSRLTALTALDVPMLGFVAFGLLSAVWNDVPALVAGLGLLALVKGLLAFQIFARLPLERRAVRPAAAALVAIVLASVGVGVAQRLGGQAVFGWMGRAAYFADWEGGKVPSIFQNHNAFGHVVVLGGLLAVGWMRTASGAARRRWALVAVICLAGLLISASRESWLAAAAALAAAAWRMRSPRLAQIALATLCVLVIGGTAVYAASPLMREEIGRRTAGVSAGWHDYRLGFTGMEYRGEYRIYVILKSGSIFADHPWLGTGPGRFGGHVAEIYPSPVYDRYDFQPLFGTYIPLDVFWSRLLTESGVLGAGCYLAALAAAARIFWRACGSADAQLRGLALGGWMVWVAVVIFAVFAPALEDPLVAIPFWAWAGLVWALGRGEGSSGPASSGRSATLPRPAPTGRRADGAQAAL